MLQAATSKKHQVEPPLFICVHLWFSFFIVLTGIIQRLAGHDLGQGFGGAVLGEAATGEAAVEFRAQPAKRLEALEFGARAGLEGMRLILLRDIGHPARGAGDSVPATGGRLPRIMLSSASSSSDW